MSGIVLVAEDEELSQRMVAAVIRQCGFEVKLTSNGREVLDELRAGLVPEIMLLDLEMPEMSGIEVLKALHHIPADDRCPIIVFTADNHEATVREAIILGADDFVVKPFKSQELAQRIKDLTFELGERELKQMLHDLHTQDIRLAESLRRKVGPNADVYPLPSTGKRLCISLPKGQSPQVLARSGMRELKGKLAIFRECEPGWRKVWPRSGRALTGQLPSAS